ncbi:MAG: hypothetical protein NTY55_02820 [Flavobacteriia bacterium]|nr:hypothetical protein [Flavobacteriia bacterium]
MKGKLVKCNHFYALQIDSDIIAVSLDRETEEHTVNYKHQLSLKNCEAIERGYDLDELADEFAKTKSSHSTFQNTHKRDFREGFQKALEILGDKKFSEDDVLKIVTHVLNELVLVDGFDKKYLFPESIYQETTTKCKSLQQTEWQVEVVMDRIPADLAPGGWDVFPKLDAEGCIILKKEK